MATRDGTVGAVDSGRVWLAGIVGTAVAAALNALVVYAALALGVNRDLDFQALNGPGAVIFFTVIGLLGATLLFWVLTQRSPRPLATFRRVGLIVLLVSFLPDLGLLTQPVVGWGDVVTLMLTHVVAFAVILAAFSRVARA